MSGIARIFNPTTSTLAVSGSGFSPPRMSAIDRLALGLNAGDAGVMVYDTTLAALFLWVGAAWFQVGGAGSGPQLLAGLGSPEGVQAADPGSIYTDITIPTAPVQYWKGSGSGAVGWV